MRYMKYLSHNEFGLSHKPWNNPVNHKNPNDINYWLEQWYFTYLNCHEAFENKDNVHFICYEKLCASKEYWLGILKMLCVKETYDFTFQESQKEVACGYVCTAQVCNTESNNTFILYSTCTIYE